MKSKKTAKKKTKTKMAKNRKSIPDKVKLKIWNDSAGRCEFRGCNKPLWYNELTFSDANFGELAHIIGAKKGGPRGTDASEELQTDPNNIMLLCTTCHNEIDEDNLQTLYPAELLREMKNEHEERIKSVTEITHDCRTEVLVFKCNIDKRIVDVSVEEAKATVLTEKYWMKGKGIMLDFTNGKGDGEKDFWDYNSKLIAEQIGELKSKGLNATGTNHLSVFALAPMPLLMVLGKHLSDTSINKIELFQRHRDTQNWKWKSSTTPLPNYIYRRPSFIEGEKEIVLVISLSDSIKPDKFPDHLRDNHHLYEITIDTPNTLFLQEKSQISEFERIYRIALNEIQAVHGKDCVLHLIPAMPAPIAIKCGMTLLPKKDVKIKVYDFNKQFGGMREVLTLN